jgi:hypothetical protein
MNFSEQGSFFYKNLKEAADHTLAMVSQFVGVNSFCVASNDRCNSLIFSAFHRNEVLFEAGTNIPFYDAY